MEYFGRTKHLWIVLNGRNEMSSQGVNEDDWELGNLHPTIFEEWGPVTYQIQRNSVTTGVLPDSVCHSVWSQRPHHA